MSKKTSQYTSVHFRWLIAGVLMGLVLGYILFSSIKPKETIQPVKTVIPATKIARFVSPMVSSEHYKNYNFKELTDLEQGISEFITSSKKNSQAKSVSVYFRDLTNDKWFGINEHEMFSPASLLKVPIMIAMLKLAESDPNILKYEIHFKGRQEQQYTDTKSNELKSETTMISGLTYSIDKLLSIMIIGSDNEATILLINFLDANHPGFLNKVQEDLGLKIDDQTGINDDFISVKRYSSFFRTLYNASYLSEEMSEKALVILSRSGYGHGMRQVIPKSIPASHKFGDKEISPDHFQIHHFAIVYHARKPFLLGIMTRGNDPELLKQVVAAITEQVLGDIDAATFGEDDSYIHRDLD